MAQLTPLEQVQLDAERITLKRIQEQKELKEWQESQDGTVSLEDKPEVAVEVETETVTTKKGKK